ncbi:tRNA 2-selenouridine(34) synthase MnmH [Pedobacter cryoconitis]|uniref:tRNA 2-selenouridine synthase n=1 Tax=Pedobacter cryoconitis TaxID=188932 RepID=A0A7X0MGV6_9SPHI|nr:tRNA 2-selenouridine(34) synthase MnmH [Pedobacter cryoconitis]MBB6498196.1 tRNA 2-selenouridine synthase [Pedobacter cryoconitis]
MTKPIAISDFLGLADSIPLIDVRTPLEFVQGHIPGAFNLPIFTNEERVSVGTTYKQVGREEAILLGFDITGSKWSGFIKEALEIAPQKKIAVHCWRGGMRSGAMAWALNLYGFEVYLIEGGYKSYRRWALQQFDQGWKLSILGGKTGSGKTKILHHLQTMNEQIIDLEDLAQHQGSSYGTMNKMIQPTQEQFENNLACQLNLLDPERKIWVEDESLTIGKRVIPQFFWRNMRNSVLINVNVPLQQRVEILVEEYGRLDKDFLIECTQRIWKRLGPEQTKHAILAIEEDRMADFIGFVLVYYDKTYKTGLGKRAPDKVFSMDVGNSEFVSIAQQIIDFSGSIPVVNMNTI